MCRFVWRLNYERERGLCSFVFLMEIDIIGKRRMIRFLFKLSNLPCSDKTENAGGGGRECGPLPRGT